MGGPEESHHPRLRVSSYDKESLIRVCGDPSFVKPNEAVQVEYRLPLAAESEMDRPSATLGGAGFDKRHKRAAFLVAIDAGLLQCQGHASGSASGKMDVFQAARRKPLAEGSVFARRRLQARGGKWEQVSLSLNP